MKHIKGFDGLRAIAITLVLMTHLGIANIIEEDPYWKKNMNMFSGLTGVMIFFCISGFLITSLLLFEKQSTGRIHAKHFFIRRFLRLLPPLLVFFFMISTLMFFHQIPQNYLAVALSFFYLYNYVNHQYYTSELAHTWSLGVEEQFYLIWPFLMCGLKNLKSGIIICCLLILSCLAWKMIYTFPAFYNEHIHLLANRYFLDRWFIPACLPIIIGCLCSLVLFGYPSLEKSLQHNYLFLLSALFLFCAQLFIPNLSALLIEIFQPIGVSLFLLWIFCNQSHFIVDLLEWKPISFLGKISYGIYVYQGLFLLTGPKGTLWFQQSPVNICLVFIIALASYFLLEKNIMQYKKKYSIPET